MISVFESQVSYKVKEGWVMSAIQKLKNTRIKIR